MAQTVYTNDTYANQRADVVATVVLPKLSRAYVQLLFKKGRVKVNGQASKPSYRLRRSDVLTIDFDEAELEQIPEIELPVLYEDKDVVVVNKPAGVISHSRGKHWSEPSVASFMRQKTALAGERSGIVHRLDRATSGVMICAKHSEALSFLQRQFSQRKVVKTYVAVVQGHCEPKEAVIDVPVERNPKFPATFRASANGKPATTHYKVTASGPRRDQLELTPATGRSHQLRVHLQHVGHPIVGDTLYGGQPSARLMLHAYKLTIMLPSRVRKTFTAAVPPIVTQSLTAD